MNVLFVNTSEKTGGAAIAAGRIATALKKQGVNVSHCFRKGKTGFYIERFAIWAANGFSKSNLFAVDIANCGEDITKLPEFKEADIIHLHWINQGFISINGLTKIFDSGKPVVWTMHDMWPFTGICHHAYNCKGYIKNCGNCHLLKFPHKKDYSYQILRKKLSAINTENISVVAVSNWLAERAKESSIFCKAQISVIPNTISLKTFHRYNENDFLEKYGIFDNETVILFGAAKIDEPIKGLDILSNAIDHLCADQTSLKEKLTLVLFGNIKDPSVLQRIHCKHVHIGLIENADDLARLYSCGSAIVCSSHYETFGQTLIEAQACGCIPISFGNSGQTDIIEHKVNGYLADYPSSESLANGIFWAITEGSKIPKERLRENVEKKYSEEVVSQKYIQIYQSLSVQQKG